MTRRPRGRSPFVLADEAISSWLKYLQDVNRQRLWALARRYWFDALVIAGVGVGLAEQIGNQGDKDGPLGPLWFDVLAILAMTLPFFARRRFSFGVPIAVGVTVAASSFVDERMVPSSLIPILASLSAFVLMGMVPDRSQAIAGLAVGIGVAAIVAHNDPTGGFDSFSWTIVVFAIAWAIGFAVSHKLREAEDAKERATRAVREREERARLAVSEERTRIARELHDVVGHSVSVMTVQASAARRLLRPDQAKERDALLVVEHTGREALAEMRRMVGVLRRPEEAPALAPQPSLEYLDKLVEHARETGLPVELHIEGEPVQLPAGVDLAAYRLVQEGLTNALKHAQAQHAEVLVRYGERHIEVTVSDDGRGAGSGDGGGHGLVGIRERISVYGGELEAGPRIEGGYRLRATIPVL